VNARRKEETVNSWLVTYESELDRHIRPRLGQRCEGEGPHGVAEPHGVVVLGAMLMMKISVSNGGREGDAAAFHRTNYCTVRTLRFLRVQWWMNPDV
jgi:hypothetical protein